MLRLSCLTLHLLSILATADDADPKTANGWLKRGAELFSKRKFADAVKAYTECLKLDPKNATALDSRGSTYFMLGKFKESVADFDSYIQLKPAEANGHWRRGISLYYAG